MSIPTTAIAQLEWSLNVECPKCEKDNDLASGEHDSENAISRAIFCDDWDSLEGHEVTCEHCDHEFKLNKVEY